MDKHIQRLKPYEISLKTSPQKLTVINSTFYFASYFYLVNLMYSRYTRITSFKPWTNKHLIAVVRPGSELHKTSLLIEWEISDVNFTR